MQFLTVRVAIARSIATRTFATNATLRTSSPSQVPQHIDLLERYRGLVALGKIQNDEEQIRIIMQLRRLQKELDGYAPPALSSRYLNGSHREATLESGPSHPWWSIASDPKPNSTADEQALVRVRSHAEEIFELTTPKAIQGLLLTGPPGSGKSFLIDLWLSAVPTPFKARKHYSELVLEIYRGVWEETRHRMAAIHTPENPAQENNSVVWNKSIRNRWRELLSKGALPIRWLRQADRRLDTSSNQPTIAFVVAQRLLLRHWLLVFDEIQLLDVSSATLLADVLSWFWRMGGVIVGSSNKVPDDLYKNGVQRERLEPFVEALKARCPVVIIRCERDWRAVRAKAGSVRTWYVYGQEEEFEDKMRKISDNKTDAEPRSENLTVFGRAVSVPWSAGGACKKFSFAQLCDESLGSADYMTLASTYHTVIITSIPILKLAAKNQARRFISLIDALYEARCRVICLAETQPERLFFPDAPAAVADRPTHRSDDVDVMMAESVAETQDVYRPNVSSYAAPNMSEAPRAPAALTLDTLSIFSGKDEQFAFKRALSRLLEMTSEGYAREEEWAPLPRAARQWERRTQGQAPPISVPVSQAHARTRWAPSAHAADESAGDPAREAAAPLPGVPRLAERPAAPRLGEAHVWGVRDDWGARAGHWGRGARANEHAARNSPRGHGRT
ncbi:hypothetical protein WOLCODRAFT_81546 [Wolfiporia cocos MD-104 SS10]|uniref:AFG1-like ATPase n=1 Tax=Wolfiporia cocos (strain MD-104) TaxID=742152 RepID=A0A2H3JBJ9_WOLCO|nr:hypothetical protein WOLCODRAFT_81546 [Wolfiporia cocos MD-104 SS10]